jgi:small subunit ribosomal protein S20
MPHHKSSKKRVITSKKQNLRNRVLKTRINTTIKQVASAKTKKDADGALKEACSIIDKAAKKNVIHKKNAAHKKSRLMLMVNKIAE